MLGNQSRGNFAPNPNAFKNFVEDYDVDFAIIRGHKPYMYATCRPSLSNELSPFETRQK